MCGTPEGQSARRWKRIEMEVSCLLHGCGGREEGKMVMRRRGLWEEALLDHGGNLLPQFPPLTPALGDDITLARRQICVFGVAAFLLRSSAGGGGNSGMRWLISESSSPRSHVLEPTSCCRNVNFPSYSLVTHRRIPCR